MNAQIRIKKERGALIPCYKTEGSSGADVCAFLTESVTLRPLERKLIPTGLYVTIPSGYEIQVRPRSGLALKSGVTVLNSPGTIDSDYRGEIGIILINLGEEPFEIKNGDRIAQLVCAQTVQLSFCETDELEGTERGAGGFGSTGIR